LRCDSPLLASDPNIQIVPRKAIEEYVKTLPPDTYVLIDEAYHHFALSSPDYVSFWISR